MIRYIHGSEDSLDVDVFYVFEQMPSFQECQLFCSSKEENRNIITIEDGIVTNCFKGTIDEVNNGLFATYALHQQEYDNVITKKVKRDVLIKFIRVIRCLLSHCSKTTYREKVKKSLKSHSWNTKLEVLQIIDWYHIDDFGKSGSKEDVYKIFAFQLGQALGLISNQEYYTKSSVSNAFPELKKYLYREKDSDITHLVQYIQKFIDVALKFETEEIDEFTFFKSFNKSIHLKTEKYKDIFIQKPS